MAAEESWHACAWTHTHIIKEGRTNYHKLSSIPNTSSFIGCFTKVEYKQTMSQVEGKVYFSISAALIYLLKAFTESTVL